MKDLIIPKSYCSPLDVWQTEQGIKFIKDTFQTELSAELRLRRITAPIAVPSGTGLNDNLNGVEEPVHFPLKALNGNNAEIVQSLAKWKRYALWRHHIAPGMGIYTDMNAIRPDEVVDNIHSIYVDQWDWEK
ncbi:MAG: aspartate--ammonia ligase, partial [Bacteroidales bacterium]